MKYLKLFEEIKEPNHKYIIGDYVVPLDDRITEIPYKIIEVFSPEYNSIVNGHNEWGYGLETDELWFLNELEFRESDLRPATEEELVAIKYNL